MIVHNVYDLDYFMAEIIHSSQPAVTLSLRIPSTARDKLENLALATGRTKSFLAAEAIEHYLAIQAWQVDAIEQALKKANSKTAKFYTHEVVSDWLNSWGTEQELDPPA